jgi:A/G-specific adenine glycosylase
LSRPEGAVGHRATTVDAKRRSTGDADLVRDRHQVEAIGRAVEGWGTALGGASRRPELPWRSTRDPWAVLVSEVMAQQTQLSRVVPAYLRFMDRFPTPVSCAAASTGDVLRTWQGLGYNRRARNLHRAAQAVVADHGGRLPSDLSGLLALPGVGAYTARAVLAFAFGVDVGVVDTNAGRVLSRAVAGRAVSAVEAQRLVDAMVPPGRGWWFGQALLDLGAGICVAGTPHCAECPIHRRCRWAGTGRSGTDPAAGSAGVSVPQSRFDGSDRQGRGRLIDALRVGEVPAAMVASVVGWEDDPDRVERVVAGLVAEGMVVRTTGGALCLP